MNTYLIFDVNKPLMSSREIQEGKSNADAARKYAKKHYPNAKLRASGSNFVEIAAQECVIEGGKPLVKAWKRKTWFELTTE